MRDSMLVVGLVSALAACEGSGPRQTASEPQLKQPMEWLFRSSAADSGLSLIATAVNDTVQLGEAVRLAYFIRNAGPATPFRNDPLFFTFGVVAPDGDILRPLQNAEPGSLGSVPDLTLPRDGILGQVVNLSCAAGQFSRANVDLMNKRCLWRYDFSANGVYRIVVHYSRPRPPVDAVLTSGTVLQSDTVMVFVATHSE